MKAFFKVVAFLGLAVVLVTAGVVGAAFAFKQLPFQEEVIDRSGPTLLQSVQDISQYHGAIGNFEVVLDQERDVKWVPGFIAGERSLFVAAGTVNAYVDFSGLAEGDLTVSEDGQTVTVRLPESQLDRPNLDQDRTYLYSQDRGVVDRIGDAISAQDQQEFYQLAVEKIADAAAASELREQADANTRAMLAGMLEGLGYAVEFED